MLKIQHKWSIPLVGAALLLSACGGQTGAIDPEAATQTVGTKQHGQAHPNDPKTIPSYDSQKTVTTNERGQQVRGMGMNVYSLIGSSSLTEGGISSHIRSRLESQGIDGVKVFVLDDSVILARSEPQIVTNQPDELQKKVLNPVEGMSGKGSEINMQGVSGQNPIDTDNMANAKELVESMFDGHVQIMTVTNPQALDLIDSITRKLQASPVSEQSVASDIAKLLKMAKK